MENKVGERIRYHRLQRGMSQERLALCAPGKGIKKSRKKELPCETAQDTTVLTERRKLTREHSTNGKR